MGGAAISQKLRQQILDLHQWTCYYCATPLSKGDNKYADNYPCLNLWIPKRYGGRPVRTNFVGCCRKCVTIKLDINPTALGGIEGVRKFINKQRYALGLSYCQEWFYGDPPTTQPILNISVNPVPPPIVPPIPARTAFDDLEDFKLKPGEFIEVIEDDKPTEVSSVDPEDDSDIDPALSKLPPDFFSKPSTLIRGELRPLHPELQDSEPTSKPKPGPTTNPLNE